MDAVRYSAGGTSIVVVPGRGGKIASLRDSRGREWLTPGDGSTLLPPGTPFEHAEMCGWDECVPTIERSTTLRGRVAADHGDVWDRAWRRVAPDRLAVDIPSVGVRFERGVAISPHGTLTLSYRAEAGAEATEVLWAAHPLFCVGPEDHITVDARSPLWAVSGSAAVREPRSPEATINAPRLPGDAVKYYVDPEESPRWARIDRRDGGGLDLRWEGEGVRALGVWIDRARFAAEDVVAFEPSTGWYDSLERAGRHGRVLRLSAGQAAEWRVSVSLRSR